ncbi:MAG: hypothetical protein IJH50_12790 [Kiritimatiellae bacterium]|nr:hypothetical protein [Kiritimatiellia bacterium]
MIDLIARAVGKFVWDAVENASNKHDYNSKAPERRKIAQDNATRRRACFEYYFKQEVGKLKKSDPSASGFSRDALEMYVKGTILDNATKWAESLSEKSQKEYQESKRLKEDNKTIKMIQEFWSSRSDGAYETYGKAYYKYLRSGESSAIQKLKVLELASKYKIPDDRMRALNEIVEFVIKSDGHCDPVGVSGKVRLPADAEKLKADALMDAERAAVLKQWAEHNSVYFEDGDEEEYRISTEAESICRALDDGDSLPPVPV